MDNQKLDEVRRTLRHLQNIASEPVEENHTADRNSIGVQDPEPDTSHSSDDSSTLANDVSKKKMSAITDFAGAPFPIISIGAIIGIGLAGLAGWIIVGADTKPLPEVTEAANPGLDLTGPKPTGVDAFVAAETSEAQRLISAGKIDEARRRLIRLDHKSPEAALALARSYDPNYLRLIPGADAAADPKEAERWYRSWRDIAASKGLALQEDRLNRIINAMY
ncbi:MAG: hypothetical protein KTR19_03950 [Hyphomicrobiales bacterium]|nr:hypothetical protein [Hyphomicrobiales bacterium]